MKLEFDPEVDAAYVRIQEHGVVAKNKRIDKQRIVDYDDDNEIVGIEFMGVSNGVSLDELPYRHELEKLFDGHNFKVYA